jgi:hypothetical protein
MKAKVVHAQMDDDDEIETIEIKPKGYHIS